MTMLRVDRLSKIYQNTFDAAGGGIRGAQFSLDPGTFFTLLGPSGCGKTTTLRCLAGLEIPDEGRVVLGDTVLYDSASNLSVPMNLRNIGMVFQSYAIWPHMTVFENVAFPLKVAKDRRYGRTEIEDAVRRALHTVSLDGYEARSATQLSGGQQQRVALARAIVRHPGLLLLDEPLSNLDAQLREEMRTELLQLQREIGVATIYVTHDQAEALALSDRIAVINRGRIMQLGAPRDIYFHPANEFVARFIGASNIVRATTAAPVSAGDIGPVQAFGGSALFCTFTEPFARGAAVAVCVRPETISIVPTQGPTQEVDVPAGANSVTGRVRTTCFLGQFTRCDVAVADATFQVVADPHTAITPGDEVTLSFPVAATLAVPPEADARSDESEVA